MWTFKEFCLECCFKASEPSDWLAYSLSLWQHTLLYISSLFFIQVCSQQIVSRRLLDYSCSAGSVSLWTMCVDLPINQYKKGLMEEVKLRKIYFLNSARILVSPLLLLLLWCFWVKKMFLSKERSHKTEVNLYWFRAAVPDLCAPWM